MLQRPFNQLSDSSQHEVDQSDEGLAAQIHQWYLLYPSDTVVQLSRRRCTMRTH